MEKVARRYMDFVNTLKKGKDNPKKGKLPFIPNDAWPKWLEYWDSEEYQNISQGARNNRLSEPLGPGTGIVKHKGGSKSAIKYASELAKERGCDPRDYLFEAYTILHVNKDGTYTDEKSAEIGRAVAQRAEELRRTLPDSEVNMKKVYLEVIELNAKNRMFGGGSLSATFRSDSFAGTSQFHSQDRPTLRRWRNNCRRKEKSANAYSKRCL